MFARHFPIPAENVLNPANVSKLGYPPLGISNLYSFHRNWPSNLRLRASNVASGAGVTRESPPEEETLPAGLRKELMPKHVAVIMDGNVRWARRRNLPGSMGHDAGVRSLRKMIELCCKWNIPIITVFAFSYDNWHRSKAEVDFLMALFERVLKSELDTFIRNGIRISVIGDTSKLPNSLQNLINQTVEDSKSNTRLQLIVAASYSGRYDVVQACRSIARKAKEDLVQIEDIDEALIEQELETRCTEHPHPDLLIRSSGELRISNFLLWQCAYSEFVFVDALWPDFGEDDFIWALTSYQQRQRRFGGRSS